MPRNRREGPQPAARRPPPERNGWKLYQWRGFGLLFAELVEEVERLQRADPAGYRSHPATRRLAAIFQIVTSLVPADPASPAFRQGNTLGKEHRHWFSVGFFERYRLFFRFRSDARAIVYAWVHDEHTLRARGARSDAYAVFARMLESGRPPSDWDALLAQSEGLLLPGDTAA